MFTQKQLQRFRERIIESTIVDENGCWIWTKSKHWNGYSNFSIGGGNNARGHRISYLAFIGPIGPKLDVCHHCDVRHCVNPDHLFVGTRSQNILDASAKNRVSRTHQRKGSLHPSSKLKESDIPHILSMLKRGETKVSIARQYGVSDRVILLIGRGELWRHVERQS